jgi:hypothetical protein
MKIYSKQELDAKALEVFEQYPDQDKVFARQDGNVFFSENLADLDKGKLKVYPLERSNIVKVDIKEIEVTAKIVKHVAKVESVKDKAPAKPVKEESPIIPLVPADASKEILGEQGETTGKFEPLPPNDDSAKVSEHVKEETPAVVEKEGTPKVDATLGKEGKNPETRNSTKATK